MQLDKKTIFLSKRITLSAIHLKNFIQITQTYYIDIKGNDNIAANINASFFCNRLKCSRDSKDLSSTRISTLTWKTLVVMLPIKFPLAYKYLIQLNFLHNPPSQPRRTCSFFGPPPVNIWKVNGTENKSIVFMMIVVLTFLNNYF